MALNITKPNIRKMFVPDPNHVIVELDVKQGDAQVVAWEAQALKLMAIFEAQFRGELMNELPIDVHSQNALIISPELKVNSKGRVPEAVRQIYKSCVHATNYAASPYGLSHKVGLTIPQVKTFQTRWFAANPEIPQWHESIEMELMTKRSVTNIFGYRRFFFGRIDDCLPEALAWKPQSTVALVVNAGIRKVRRKYQNSIQRLLQVHDSALYQIHKSLWTPAIAEDLVQQHLITLPYPRPLTMGIDIKCSDISWGDCIPVEEYFV